jgi:hypothetical protein
MTEENKLDNVVYNTETQKYDAYLKPCAISLGAPVITTTVITVAWKNRSVNKLNHKIQTRFKEIILANVNAK